MADDYQVLITYLEEARNRADRDRAAAVRSGNQVAFNVLSGTLDLANGALALVAARKNMDTWNRTVGQFAQENRFVEPPPFGVKRDFGVQHEEPEGTSSGVQQAIAKLVEEGLRVKACPWCCDGSVEYQVGLILEQHHGIVARETQETTQKRRERESQKKEKRTAPFTKGARCVHLETGEQIQVGGYEERSGVLYVEFHRVAGDLNEDMARFMPVEDLLKFYKVVRRP